MKIVRVGERSKVPRVGKNGGEEIPLGIYYGITLPKIEAKGCGNAVVSTVQDDLQDEKKIDVFELQRVVRAERYAMQSIAKDLLPKERVSICLRTRIKKRGNDYYEDIKVWQHLNAGKAFYSGLAVCGSVWTCPVCASKISERRKNELHKATTAHKQAKGYLAMLTLTIRHKRTDKLDALLDAFNEATSKMMKRKEFSVIREEMGIIGRVKALEVTHGQNGWHPHAHIVIFYENETDLTKMRKRMYKLWDAACEKFGLSTTESYGIDLQGADHVQAYLAKHGSWSIEQEMTKSHIKKGRESNMTPFDLLRDVLHNDDDYSKALYREYAVSFKGKRQLHWSRGLKDHFAITDKTDEELAKEKVEQADLLGLITSDQWREIIRRDQRAQLLTNIEKYGFDIGLKLTLN